MGRDLRQAAMRSEEALPIVIRHKRLQQILWGAVNFYQKSFRVWVLFWQDKTNTLPTEPGCELTLQDHALDIVISCLNWIDLPSKRSTHESRNY